MNERVEQVIAYKLAEEIISRARNEWWNYVSLSPFLLGTSEKRTSFQVLASLTDLPAEIKHLTRCNSLELRGTQIVDLTPLAGLENLQNIEFEGIPACSADPELKRISEIKIPSARIEALRVWLRQQAPVEPPEPRPDGPVFIISDKLPITLADPRMNLGADSDQDYLHDEVRIKAASLAQICNLADNISPRLGGAAIRYEKLVKEKASNIGARSIWSHANTLQSVWEVHLKAVSDARTSEELPSSVAACLDDLLQTHRVWFLGHPGAREVQERASSHARDSQSAQRREASKQVVEAAQESGIVHVSALIPALENFRTSFEETPSGAAALGELEDWAYNLIATVAQKIWIVAKDPPGGFVVHGALNFYLAQFFLHNELALGSFVKEFMSYGPMWWDSILSICQRFRLQKEN